MGPLPPSCFEDEGRSKEARHLIVDYRQR